MTRRVMGAFAAAALLSAAGAAPARAQTACQQIQITTTRTASPITVTPLDAIAFPAPLVPATSVVTRLIMVCPPGVLPVVTPVVNPVTVVDGSSVFGVPVLQSPVVAPVIVGPGAGAAPSAAAVPLPPAAPPVTGAVPEDTVAGLAAQSARFDRTVVTVAGTAGAVTQTSDEGGAPLTAFQLEAGGQSVGVIVWGHAAVRAGDRVRVSGPFYLSTPFAGPSGTPWHRVIEAQLLER